MVVNISVPGDWADLSQKQLLSLFRCIARRLNPESATVISDFGWAEIITDFLIKYNKFKVVGRYGDDYMFRKKKIDFVCPADIWAQACAQMKWVEKIPSQPIRLDYINKNTPICDTQLYSLEFQNFIALENYWQTFNAYSDISAISCMAEILYNCEDISLDSAATLSVIYWWSSAKLLLSENFPNFLKPASSDAAEFSAVELRRNSDSLIRALTKGDISKRDTILHSTLWVALAELDALAKEYDDLNKKYPSK